MKRTIVILTAVAAAAIAVYTADKVTRVHPKAAMGPTKFVANEAAPEIRVMNLDDRETKLQDYQGKVVLVNFWATWCDPCRIEIPWLIEMQEKYGARGFTVLGIAMDEEGKQVVAPFVAKERYEVNGMKLPMNYPIVIGNENVADKFGGLLGYPTSVLISRDGKQLKRITGLISYDEMSKAIEGAL
jgi:thiol-disulfide isomerase/thioredoxin